MRVPATFYLKAILSALLLFNLSGCSPKPEANNNPPPTIGDDKKGDDSQKLNEYQRDLLAFAEQKREEFYDVQKYSIQGSYDWGKRELTASVKTEFKLIKKTNAIIFDSGVTSVLWVKSDKGATLPFEYKKNELTLNVDISSLSPEAGKTLTVIIDYKIGVYEDSTALTDFVGRLGDPNKSRVVHTTAEPKGAHTWFPCNDNPADRALFAMQLTTPVQDRMISNGDLLSEVVSQGQRTTSYQTRYSLPTYLMAFAAGEFIEAKADHNGLPVMVWARKGSKANLEGVLVETVRQIAHFEKLMVPYPFEKYAVVLIPEFGGGMEHASITFNAEDSSSQGDMSRDIWLQGHELGHQWFGDYVTVKTWDDLWIKEGMATLLASEVTRSFEDKYGRGDAFGSTFNPAEGDAVVDPELPADQKYTSGPYDRAAWVLTQMRVKLGEEKFWSGIRQVLKKYAFGNVSTEEFLAEFKPFFSEEDFATLERALKAKKLPKIEVRTEKDEANNYQKLFFSVSDPESILLFPMTFKSTSSLNEVKVQNLVSGKELELPRDDKTLLELNHLDAHPHWSVFAKLTPEVQKEFELRIVPQSLEQVELLKAAGPSTQSTALKLSSWNVGLSEYEALYQKLGSDSARLQAIKRACKIMSEKNDEERNAWQNLVKSWIQKIPTRGTGVFGFLAACPSTLAKDLYASDWELLNVEPTGLALSETKTFTMSLIPLEKPEAFSYWGSMADKGSSLRMRTTAVRSLVNQFNSKSWSPEDQAAWLKLFRDLSQNSHSQTFLRRSLEPLIAAKDVKALDSVAEFIANSAIKNSPRKRVLCSTYRIAMNPENNEPTQEWLNYVQKLKAMANYSNVLLKTMDSPKASCGL